MESMVKNKDNFIFLNWIKMLASVGVLLSHYSMFLPIENAPGYQTPLQIFYKYGGYGVILFLGFSGYTSMYSIDKSGTLRDWKKYIWPKIIRIWPLHMSMALFCFFVQQLRLENGKEFFVYASNGITDLIANALFAEHLMTPELSLNGPAWSLSVTFAAYVLFYITIRYIKRPEYVFGFISVIFSYSLFMVISGRTSGFPIIVDNIQYVASFFVGSLTFIIIKKYMIRKSVVNIFLLLVLALIIIAFRESATAFGTEGPTLMVIWLIIPAMLIVGSNIKLNLWFDKFPSKIKWFQGLYLHIYLCHFPVMLSIQTLKDFGWINPNYRSKLFLFQYFGIVIVLSMLCRKLFNKRSKE